jgi:hypothetical protein
MPFVAAGRPLEDYQFTFEAYLDDSQLIEPDVSHFLLFRLFGLPNLPLTTHLKQCLNDFLGCMTYSMDNIHQLHICTVRGNISQD